jgi:tyrosine-protein kinase Etk/Wzc
MTTQTQAMPQLDQERSYTGPAAPPEALPVIRARGSLDAQLLEVLTHIARRKWLVVKVTGVSVLAGVAFCLLLPVRYTAVTQIMPPQQNQSATAMLMNQLANVGGGGLSAIAAKQLGIKNQNDIYLGLLGSRPVADAIIQRFGLRKLYRSRDMTGARQKLATYTSIVSAKNGFITLTVTDTSKRRAAEIANAYTDQLRALMNTLAVTEASQRRLFYEDQLKYAKEALVTAEVALEQVQQKKGLVALDAQAKAMIEGLAALQAQVVTKQVELEAIRSYSTDHNPEVQLAERELTTLQEEASQLRQRNPSLGSANLGLEDVPAAGLEYLRAEHEVKYRQVMFDLLMKQFDAAKLDEAQEAAIIQVVEPAIEPDRRSSPQRVLVLLTSLLAGVLAGSLFALFSWAKEIVLSDPQRLRQLKELQRAFGTTRSVEA